MVHFAEIAVTARASKPMLVHRELPVPKNVVPKPRQLASRKGANDQFV